MISVKNVQAVIERLGRWNPLDLALIESLSYQGSWPPNQSEVRISALFQRRDLHTGAGWPSWDSTFCRVVLVFQSISDLQLKEFGNGPKQLSGFSIEELGNRGLEGIRYKIDDYESGAIRFFCKNIEILSCDEAGPRSRST